MQNARIGHCNRIMTWNATDLEMLFARPLQDVLPALTSAFALGQCQPVTAEALVHLLHYCSQEIET
jgi:hypothetical protein